MDIKFKRFLIILGYILLIVVFNNLMTALLGDIWIAATWLGIIGCAIIGLFVIINYIKERN